MANDVDQLVGQLPQLQDGDVGLVLQQERDESGKKNLWHSTIVSGERKPNPDGAPGSLSSSSAGRDAERASHSLAESTAVREDSDSELTPRAARPLRSSSSPVSSPGGPLSPHSPNCSRREERRGQSAAAAAAAERREEEVEKPRRVTSEQPPPTRPKTSSTAGRSSSSPSSSFTRSRAASRKRLRQRRPREDSEEISQFHSLWTKSPEILDSSSY